MWSKGHQDLSGDTLRHSCEQSDEMETYGWSTYDPRSGGSQRVNDVHNGLNLNIDFIRLTGKRDSRDWAARVSALPRSRSENPLKTTAILYISLEGLQTNLDARLHCAKAVDGVDCQGSTPRTGDFQLSMQRARSISPSVPSNVNLRSASVSDELLWEAKC